jgi:hypothetical protein
MLHVLMAVSRKMIDRLIEEAFTNQNNMATIESREKLFGDLFHEARVKLASLKDASKPSLLDRWSKSRTNRNDLIRLMHCIESSNLPAKLDALLLRDPEKPTVSKLKLIEYSFKHSPR